LEDVLEMLDLDGHLEVNVHAANEYAFRHACKRGRLNIAQHLLELRGHRRVDVHAEDEYAFRHACADNRLDVLRQLLGLEGDRAINTHALNQWGFYAAANRGHTGVLQELLALPEGRCPSMAAQIGLMRSYLPPLSVWDPSYAAWRPHNCIRRHVLQPGELQTIHAVLRAAQWRHREHLVSSRCATLRLVKSTVGAAV